MTVKIPNMSFGHLLFVWGKKDGLSGKADLTIKASWASGCIGLMPTQITLQSAFLSKVPPPFLKT